MPQQVVWVHGIGDHKEGYSDPWRLNFNTYLGFPDDSFTEVLWETVFDSDVRTRGGGVLTAAELADEARVKEQILRDLTVRSAAIDTQLQLESSATADEARTRSGTRGSLLDWFRKPDEYLGDFTRYLVSRTIRTAVRDKMKEKIGPLAGSGRSISVVAHSWGTVVSYDSLMDLVDEKPELRIETLVTLGSPLWLVRRFLEDKSGRKPPNVGTWININARGDKIGGWLEPDFKVDRDFGTSSIGDSGAHGSYFIAENVAVQRDLIAPFIRGDMA